MLGRAGTLSLPESVPANLGRRALGHIIPVAAPAGAHVEDAICTMEADTVFTVVDHGVSPGVVGGVALLAVEVGRGRFRNDAVLLDAVEVAFEVDGHDAAVVAIQAAGVGGVHHGRPDVVVEGRRGVQSRGRRRRDVLDGDGGSREGEGRADAGNHGREYGGADEQPLPGHGQVS